MLLAEEVQELGGAELIPPLVWSRAEAQAQDKDENTPKDACVGAQGHAMSWDSCTASPTLHIYGGLCVLTRYSHFIDKETEAWG